MGKGWEGDLGLRYNKTIDQYFYTGVFGIGKYTGSYWFNIKSYFLNDNSKIYWWRVENIINPNYQ